MKDTNDSNPEVRVASSHLFHFLSVLLAPFVNVGAITHRKSDQKYRKDEYQLSHDLFNLDKTIKHR